MTDRYIKVEGGGGENNDKKYWRTLWMALMLPASTTHDQGGLKIALLESLVDVGTWKLAVYRNY